MKPVRRSLGMLCAFVLASAVVSAADNAPGMYVAVDLSSGSVSELSDPPDVSDASYRIGKLLMRRIPAGTFLMGSPSGESGRYDNETQHDVTLTKDYYMGVFEVTQGQWEAVIGSNPSKFKNVGKSAPVESVSWNDCQEFIQKLNAKAGGSFRLPTEAEWEYACRAGTAGAYAGTGSLDEMGWYLTNSGSTTRSVGRKKPNAWGLYDMHGNVWEWCSDWYGPYSGSGDTDPIGVSSGSRRVFRGGSWFYIPSYFRSALRDRNTPSFAKSYLVFRIASSFCSSVQ